MRPCTEAHTPPPVEFTVHGFKDGRPITFRLVRGEYFHRLGADGVFVPTGSSTYPAAAAHARRLHGITNPFARAA